MALLSISRTASRAARGRVATGLFLAVTATFVSGCATAHPPPLSRAALIEAETFPYFRIYWVGHSFQGHPLTAVDGIKSYSTTIGDSVYYGDCVTGKGLLGGGGSCRLALQVTTVIYRRHENGPLGPQGNTVIRGVPGVIYDEGRSVELYTERVAIDIFSDTPQHALAAAFDVKTLNTPGSATANLPPPVYCPGLSGPQSPRVQSVMSHLPGHPCQKAAAVITATERLAEKPLPGR